MTLSSHFGAYAWTSAATRHIPFVQPNVDVVDRHTLLFIMQIYTTILVVFKDAIRYLSSLQVLRLRGHLTIVQRVNTPTLLPFYGRQTIEILRRILGFNYLRAPGGFWIALYPQVCRDPGFCVAVALLTFGSRRLDKSSGSFWALKRPSSRVQLPSSLLLHWS